MFKVFINSGQSGNEKKKKKDLNKLTHGILNIYHKCLLHSVSPVVESVFLATCGRNIDFNSLLFLWGFFFFWGALENKSGHLTCYYRNRVCIFLLIWSSVERNCSHAGGKAEFARKRVIHCVVLHQERRLPNSDWGTAGLWNCTTCPFHVSILLSEGAPRLRHQEHNFQAFVLFYLP